MYASIWKFEGDPVDLLPRYEAAVREIPAENMRLHLCLRAPDGLILVDTCPSEEAFASFVSGIRALLGAHGLPDPDQLDGYPVELAFVDGVARR